MSRIINNLQAAAIVAVLMLAASAFAQHEHHTPPEPTKEEEKTVPGQTKDREKPDPKPAPENDQTKEPDKSPETPSVSLAELERLALLNNPTLRQADLSIRAAEGRKTQSGLLPNPIVGITAEDLSFRKLSEGGRVGFFVEQRIPLGGKLAKNRRVIEQDVRLAETRKERQRIAVLNSIRLLYLETLGAQAVVDLRKEQAALAREATGTTAELYNVGLADRPDQMKAEIAQQRAEAEYFEALNKYEEAWRKLAATIGVPEMQPVQLAGNAAEFTGEIDSTALLARLLAESPEIKAAAVKVERAKMALRRARAEKTPDLYLRGGVGYNNEIVEERPRIRRSGTEGFLEIGVTLPIFDRNQGGIKTAEAELALAEREVERLRLALRTRFAAVLSNYRTSLNLAERYRTEIVPKAKAAYEMYSVNFKNMTAAYPNVLATRGAYLQAQIEYARSLTAAVQSLALLKNFLLAGGLDAPDAPDADDAVPVRVPVGSQDGRDDRD